MRRIVVLGVLTVLLSAREAGTATVTSDTSALLSICEANPSAAVCTTGAYTRQCNQRSNPKCSSVTAISTAWDAQSGTYSYQATGAVWQNGTDPCFTGWAGVTCDEGKERVTVLELGSGGISRLPRNVSNLTALRILILANNSLEELPPGHTNLMSLSDLAMNQVDKNETLLLTCQPPKLTKATFEEGAVHAAFVHAMVQEAQGTAPGPRYNMDDVCPKPWLSNEPRSS